MAAPILPTAHRFARAVSTLRDRRTVARARRLAGDDDLRDDRLSDQLATLTAELVRPGSPFAGDDRVRRCVIDAFCALYQPAGEDDLAAPPEVEDAITTQFHRLYYHQRRRTWQNTRYRGVNIFKCPMDLWCYQELVHELRPDVIVEAGTAHGGSAYYLADLCETVGVGRVVTIDVEAHPDRPEHPRITYLTGSSTDPEVVDTVRSLLPPEGTVLVVLDSDHHRDHVRRELEVLWPMVSVGSYVVVEDTNVHGHPVAPAHPPGPMEAVKDFLAGNHRFVVDADREKFFLTFNPSGYLRRVE